MVVIPFRKKEEDPNQLKLDLFSSGKPVCQTKEEFHAIADRTLGEMPERFWFSDFRRSVPAEPHHYNSWGSYSKRMTRLGYRQLNERRPSPLKSLNGSDEYMWERKRYIQQQVC